MTLLSLVGQMSQGIEDKVSKLKTVGHMTNYNSFYLCSAVQLDY